LSWYDYHGSRNFTPTFLGKLNPFIFTHVIFSTVATPHGLIFGGNRTNRERGYRWKSQGTISTCDNCCREAAGRRVLPNVLNGTENT
jgi:hypothetical protein